MTPRLLIGPKLQKQFKNCLKASKPQAHRQAAVVRPALSDGPHASPIITGVLALALALAAGGSPAAATAGASAEGPGSLRTRLQEYSLFQSLFSGPSSPTQRLLGRVQAVQEVLQRVELLVRLREYDAARALLRGRETNLLVLDLGYAAEAYRLLPQQAGRQVVAALQGVSSSLLGPEDVSGGEALALERVRAAAAALQAVADVLTAAGD